MDNMDIDSRLKFFKELEDLTKDYFGKDPWDMYETETYDFGTLIRAIRAACGLTQDVFSKYLCTTRVTLSQIEQTRDVSDITIDMIFRLYYFASILPRNEEHQGFHTYLYNTLYETVSEEIIKRQKFTSDDIPNVFSLYLKNFANVAKYNKYYNKNNPSYKFIRADLDENQKTPEFQFALDLDHENLQSLSTQIVGNRKKGNLKNEKNKDSKKVNEKENISAKSVANKKLISGKSM